LLKDAPKLETYFGEETRTHFDALLGYLDEAGVSYVINPNLVRGLDYYSKTVFEWVTTALGAQGTVCAGGRYDGLVEQLGGRATPGVGFAMGVERLVLLLKELDVVPASVSQTVDVFIVAAGEGTQQRAFEIASSIRQQSALRVLQNMGGGSFKSQMKKADKSGAAVALILGEQEVEEGLVNIKYLQVEKAQEALAQSELINKLEQFFTRG